jgi:negative regulator of sigma F NrsF-like protein
MNCREAVRRLAGLSSVDGGDPELQQHLATCAACQELAASLPISAGPDPARISAIQQQIGRSWKPVRPVMPPGRQITLLAVLFCATAIAAVAPFGFFAFKALKTWQMVVYYGAFAVAAAFVAAIVVQRLYPGIRSRFAATPALWVGVGSLSVLVVVLFPNFNVAHFGLGVNCLEIGCIVASVAGIAFALALHRTFASSPVTASATVGFFAGLCGAAALALHCPLLTVPHILVFHFGVLVVATIAGAGVGWLVQTSLSRTVTLSR